MRYFSWRMTYKKTKGRVFMVKEEHDPISVAILGKDIKYASKEFKEIEKSIREMRRIIRSM